MLWVTAAAAGVHIVELLRNTHETHRMLADLRTENKELRLQVRERDKQLQYAAILTPTATQQIQSRHMSGTCPPVPGERSHPPLNIAFLSASSLECCSCICRKRSTIHKAVERH